MRIIYECGYDGNECEKYKVKLDENGNIKPQCFECDKNGCERCYFMGKPWARISLKDDKC